MTRWDLEGVAAYDVKRGAVGHLDVQVPGHHVAEVVHLAALGTDDRLDMLRPAPARLEHGAPDGHLSQLYQLDACLLDRTDLVGMVKALAAQLHEPIVRIGTTSAGSIRGC
ncbi:MAG TPA: hypothetical protein VF086_03685 [Propionibacteriaceae bacterium]